MFGTIAEARVAFLRLVGTESGDPELVLRGEAANAAIDDSLLVGLYNAQRFLIDVGAGDDWLTTASLTFGAAGADGISYASKPADLLRFAGDQDYPSLYDAATGRPWGHLLRDKRRRRYVTGDAFWWAKGRIYAAKLAQIPTSVALDYYSKLALPADADEVDLVEIARPLWIAEAGYHAMNEYWIPKPDGIAALENRLTRNRTMKRAEAAAALRVEDGRQNMNTPRAVGPHYFLT